MFLRQPNNTLAIAYLNAMEEMHSPLKPMTIQRRGAGHNSMQSGADGTASATYIRQYFSEGGDCRRMMPGFAWRVLRDAAAEGKIGSLRNLERPICTGCAPGAARGTARCGRGGAGLGVPAV